MKKISLYLLAIGFLTFNACQDDDTIEKTGKPSISIMERSITVDEGQAAVFDFTLDYPVSETVFIRVDVLDANGDIIPTAEPIGDPTSGNGFSPIDMEDFTVPYETWFAAGYFSYGYLGGSGYVASIPAYTDSFQLSINADLDQIDNEAPETFNFRLTPTSTMAATISEDISVTINNVAPVVTCFWTLVTNDAYEDGWNGGFITATVDGIETTYAAAGAGSTFEIGIVEGATYSFSYTSGGGTGGAPGWESENYFMLTAPDGTVFEGGSFDYSALITEGEITSGLNTCP